MYHRCRLHLSVDADVVVETALLYLADDYVLCVDANLAAVVAKEHPAEEQHQQRSADDERNMSLLQSFFLFYYLIHSYFI